MILKETDKFIIEYPESILYIDEVINYLNSKIGDIILFFESNISNKKRIIFWNDLDNYIKHIEEYTMFKSYMCADTFDGNINILTLDEAHKLDKHKDMSLDELKYNITHEFVHVMQQESELEKLNKNENDTWFWEALATNLGNPELFEITYFDISLNELLDFNNLNNNYPIVYTIGRYMLDNYSHEEIIDFIKYPKKLIPLTDDILQNTKKWLDSIKKI